MEAEKSGIRCSFIQSFVKIKLNPLFFGIFLVNFPPKFINMKQLFTVLFTALGISAMAQNEIKISEDNQSFSVGSKNSIVVNIPYGKMDIIEKELKSEMKDWGGKYNSSKGEFTATQASAKFMGDKPFDAYAKIIVSGDIIKVAVAIDLGGAFMSSGNHGTHFHAMKERMKAFALKAAKESVAEDLKTEQKILSGFEKDQKDLEKDKESLLKSIEDYKKKIADAEKKIEENVNNQSKKKEEIAKQTEKVAEVGKKQNIK